jgi:thiosulfate/3-mercaptopyruvate sulfurtransferase
VKTTPTTLDEDPLEPPPPPGILIGTDWLAERLDHPRIRLVDLRDAEAHAGAHLPGAVQLDLSSLGSAMHGLDNVLIPAGEFERLMAALGISNGDLVVAYDDQWGLAAARLVWALHFYGHAAAGVLDGGWDRWSEEGRRVTAEPVSPAPSHFEAKPNLEVAAELEWLASPASGAEPVLLDTRTQAEYEQGHLPGAKLWDWFTAVPPGSWDAARDVAELRAEWAALGVEPSREVVVYCRSGMRASHTYVVLKHARFPSVRLYDGSWQEWSKRMKGGDRG